MCIDLTEETRPVSDCASESPRVNVVKGFIAPIQSIAFGVIHQKFTIRRHPLRLNWAKIGPDDYGTRKFIGKIHRPNTSAGANIEAAMRSGRNGCTEELAIQGQSKDVVTKIHAILFELIVGQEIGTCTVGVVTAPILKFVV
jgi:hypothetical protein